MTSHNRQNRKFLGAGHVSKSIEERAEYAGDGIFIVPKDNSSIPLCPHNDYCSIRRIKGHNCFLAQEAKDCQTKKYYDKYGEPGNQMGVGSWMKNKDIIKKLEDLYFSMSCEECKENKKAVKELVAELNKENKDKWEKKYKKMDQQARK